MFHENVNSNSILEQVTRVKYGTMIKHQCECKKNCMCKIHYKL